MRRSLLCAVLLVAGCEGAAETGAGMDAQPALDTGPAVDAGSAVDGDPMAESGEPADGRAPLAAGEVRYRLEWDDTGLDVAPDGTWQVTNDRGITFAISRGWLTSYSAQLVPCWLIEGTARRAPTRTLGDWLWMLVGGVAHAGHDDEPDPSLFEVPHVEPLVSRTPLALGTVSGVPAETYCKAFYLVARSDDDAVGVPAEVPYERVTLYLEGTWQADGERHDFGLSTDLNIGRNLDLYAPGAREAGDELRLDPSTAGVEVVVHRRIAGWFEGLDPAAYDDEVALARALMPKVVDALWVEVR